MTSSSFKNVRLWAVVLLGVVSGFFYTGLVSRAQTVDLCASPDSNPVACENSRPGNPASEWDIVGAGSDSIQGFATDISVNHGEVVRFKVNTPATAYRLDIYRLGYYAGLGARKVATVTPSAALPQVQPPCATDSATGLVDCGTWAVSASWSVPATAVSGVYVAKLVRTDATAGSSHIVFVVRDDERGSDLLFQTSDTTWQAYNRYGGNSLYVGSPAGRAYKVSYNRPFTTRATSPEDWVFNAEYPMLRWLEANGYDVSYTTGVDSDRLGAELLEHKAFLSVGHDEYWSGAQRANVEAARTAGVNLAFFSGNEVFWKTRWEPSIDGSATGYRTLVSYKETHANAKIDPLPNVWTGTWRDPRFSPPADGGRPEHSLTGQLFTVNAGATTAIEVPAEFGGLRFWRNTSIATLPAGQTATLSAGTLGYEWDEAAVDASTPSGLITMSRTTREVPAKLQDYGSTYAGGLATHSLTLYRDGESNALVFGAGTVQWSWGLDTAHDREPSAVDLRMQQATLNLMTDMGAQPATPRSDLIVSPAADDTTPPVSSIASPLAGTSIPQGVPVTIQGSASDAGGTTVYVEVSTDGGSTWHRASGTSSWRYTWTPSAVGAAVLRARAVDDSANVEIPAAGTTVTVTPATGTCPCSIWNESIVPATQDAGPDNAVELGVKFRSDSAGYILGIRYYKSAANGGAHVASLWSSAGTRLATITVNNGTAAGWQTVTFDTPVAIAADTTYVASYYTPVGHYAYNTNYFTTAGVDNGVLHALAATTSPNGVFRYGSSSGFPDSSWGSANYWVDVVFDTTVVDTTPPRVLSVSPAAGSPVAPPSEVTATFNEPLNVATVTSTTFEVRDAASMLVPGSVSYDSAAKRAIFTPASPLPYLSTFTGVVRGGAAGVADPSGNPMTADYTWTFSTGAAPPPPPDQGPGGPVLVVGSTGNPFSRYYAELLRAEGLNAFGVADITTVSPAVLAGYDLVVLGNIPLTTAEATMFSDWVSGGGRLIAMRPDKKLAALLGLVDTNSTLSDQYLRINTSTAPGAGLVGETIQFHGAADLYTTSGATTLATLYSSATVSSGRPAVTLRQIGANGGQAAAFTYDLARSIVYTRQGNPAWAGQERDGTSPIRSNDMFYGGGTERDWIDLDKVAIPQADEQQRLLANLILQMNAARRPLPRFWYLPRNLKAAVVLTGDDHGNGGTAGQFATFKAMSPANCSVDDWQCVRASSYIFPNTPISADQAAGYHADGFEIGLHLNTGCGNYTAASLDYDLSTQFAEWGAKYSTLPAPTTNRTHCIVWSDWTGTASASFDHGIRLDTNYYYWPGSWVAGRPGMFTGSGMPMRFADLTGQMLDVYQAATQMTDESGQAYPATLDALLDRALGPDGYYGVFTANMHTDYPWSDGANAIVGAALARSVPVVSARQMLTWLDGRNGSTFRDITWNGAVLTFRVEVGIGARGLRAMVPATAGGNTVLSITADGAPVAFTQETIKGVAYATFAAASATYRVTYDLSTPDTIITAAPPATTTSTTAAFQFTSTEAGSTFQCALDGGAFTSCASPLTYTGLASGAHTFSVRAVGIMGPDPTPATTGWTITAPVPDTTITAGPSGSTSSTSATFEFTATIAGSTFQCSLDGAAFTTCASGVTYSSLAAGNHTFSVRAVSAGGADATPATRAWSISLPVPDTTITAGPSGLTTSATATFQFTSTVSGSTFQCSLNGAAFATCASGITYSSLADGNHTFSVRAVSAGGTDATPATRSWSVDATAPVVTALTATPLTTSATINWATNELSDSVVYYGTAATSLTSTATVSTLVTSHSVTLSGLTAGRVYYYRVSSRNAAGLTAYAPSATTSTTFTTRTVVNQAAASATITAGSLRSGAVGNLAGDDTSYYQVNSTTSGSRTSAWYASFTSVSRSLANLTVTYRGSQSRTVTQNIEIYNWSTAAWVTLDTRSIGTTETPVANLAPSGSAVNYVSTGGEVRVRVRSVSSNASFYTIGDLLRIGFDHP